jgi:hypothetical protein
LLAVALLCLIDCLLAAVMDDDQGQAHRPDSLAVLLLLCTSHSFASFRMQLLHQLLQPHRLPRLELLLHRLELVLRNFASWNDKRCCSIAGLERQALLCSI